jgi:hypothetical protein
MKIMTIINRNVNQLNKINSKSVGSKWCKNSSKQISLTPQAAGEPSDPYFQSPGTTTYCVNAGYLNKKSFENTFRHAYWFPKRMLTNSTDQKSPPLGDLSKKQKNIPCFRLHLGRNESSVLSPVIEIEPRCDKIQIKRPIKNKTNTQLNNLQERERKITILMRHGNQIINARVKEGENIKEYREERWENEDVYAMCQGKIIEGNEIFDMKHNNKNIDVIKSQNGGSNPKLLLEFESEKARYWNIGR